MITPHHPPTAVFPFYGVIPNPSKAYPAVQTI